MTVYPKPCNRIYHYDWCDDFSAARNFCMQKASHYWILSLDCDEYIENLDPSALRRCMEEYPNHTGRILIRSRFLRGGEISYEHLSDCIYPPLWTEEGMLKLLTQKIIFWVPKL